MKRILMATALTASFATSALAATEAEMAQIDRLLPGVEVSALTDTQVANAMLVINSSESRSVKMNRLSEIVGMDMPMSMAANPTEAQRAEIERIAPGVDFSTVTQAQLDTAMAAINGGSIAGDTQARVQTILVDDGTPVSTANTASAAEMAILQRYLPDLTVEGLTEVQLNTALAIVYGGGTNSDIKDKLQAMFG